MEAELSHLRDADGGRLCLTQPGTQNPSGFSQFFPTLLPLSPIPGLTSNQVAPSIYSPVTL